jgi:drug/metabolite transporter (DMT)-like permease
VLLSIAGLAVICTAAAFLIFFRLISEVGPARASVITYINPAIAVSLGVTVLGERVTPTMLIAFGTILVGSVLATRPSRRQAEARAQAQPVAASARAARAEAVRRAEVKPAGALLAEQDCG